MIMNPTIIAIIGEINNASTIFMNPFATNTEKPFADTAAPAIAPMIAWEELLGIP